MLDLNKYTTVHYGLSPEEHASRRGRQHLTRFDFGMWPLCSNGRYHVKVTRAWARVNRPAYLEKKP